MNKRAKPSSNELNPPYSEDYLHALEKMNSNAPSAPEIEGPIKVVLKVENESNINQISIMDMMCII